MGKTQIPPFRLFTGSVIIQFTVAPALTRAAGIARTAKTLAQPGASVVHNLKPRRLWPQHCRRPGRGRLGEEHTGSVEERVIEIVCENLGVNKEQVTRSTRFIEDIGADSLDIVELVMELEEEFEITIPDDQAEKIKTVGEAIEYIEREQQKK